MSVAASSRHGRVREIDFRRPSKFNREQVRRLEVAHENFCQQASRRLSAELRTELQLAFANTDQLPYSVVMAEEMPKQAYVVILRLEPLDTEVALVMEMDFAASLASRLLGGSADASAGATTLSAVETAVARRAVDSLIDTLSTTWSDMADVSFSIVGTATSPMSVQIVPPSEPSLLIQLSASLGSLRSQMTLVLPHRSVEPIAQRLEQTHYGPASSVDTLARQDMHNAMRGVDIEVRAEVGAVELDLSDVLRLRPGDVVRLRRPAQQGAVVHVDDVPAYVADPGRNGNVRAVQIREPWKAGR